MTALAFGVGAVLGAALGELRGSLSRTDMVFVSADFARAREGAADATRYASLENDLRTRLSQKRREGTLRAAAVRFRELRGGASFGIDDDQQFAPASLLKLPLSFVYFVLDEDDPGLLQRELLYARDQVRDYPIPAQREVADTGLTPGARYRIVVLLRHAVANSDNLSYYLLLQHLADLPYGRARFARTLRELGVADPASFADEVAGPREYAELFRRLYEASYLSVESSETLLSWLSAAAFDAGIAAGVPKHVTVANKFGERFFDSGEKQLHDCGIVYHEDRPYSLCVMTKGDDFAALRETIADLSRTVYAAVDASL